MLKEKLKSNTTLKEISLINRCKVIFPKTLADQELPIKEEFKDLE
jgi:hypothetical protein